MGCSRTSSPSRNCRQWCGCWLQKMHARDWICGSLLFFTATGTIFQTKQTSDINFNTEMSGVSGEYYIIPPNSGYARHLDRMTKRSSPEPSVTRSGTKKDGIGCCQILLLSLLLSFPMTWSRANRERKQGLWDAERLSELLPGSARMSQRQYHFNLPGSQKDSFGANSPLPKILDCKDKPRDQKDHKDLGGRRHRAPEKGKDAHRSQPVNLHH